MLQHFGAAILLSGISFAGLAATSAGGDQAEERWIRQSNEYTNMLVVPA
jgi:hypothetical protein